MVLRIFECLLGALLVAITLRDVVTTVVIPGESRGFLRLSRRFIFLALPLWRRRRGQRGISTSFAPVVLMASFMSWMLLLTLSFGLMIHGLRDSFQPPVDSLGRSFYMAGVSLGTIGFGDANPLGLAQCVVVAAGFCGLAVMTLVVTYLLEVRQGVGQRDAGILKLTTTAGQPPSALRLMERYAELDCRDELVKLLHGGRDWCAAVHESHTEHPSLIYFRSIDTGSGWPAALGAVMDLALIMERVLGADEGRAPAVLLREEGNRMLTRVRQLLGVKPHCVELSAADVADLRSRLQIAGYAVRDNFDSTAFMDARREHAESIAALAAHLGTPEAPLIPSPA